MQYKHIDLSFKITGIRVKEFRECSGLSTGRIFHMAVSFLSVKSYLFVTATANKNYNNIENYDKIINIIDGG